LFVCSPSVKRTPFLRSPPAIYSHFLAMPKPEAFSHVLIDQELRESGWDLLDERPTRRACPPWRASPACPDLSRLGREPLGESDRDERHVRFELDGHSGRADYVLSGERGPLCVLEAKRPDLDPYEAKEQARGYAENLRAPINDYPSRFKEFG
jgi:type I site-specific restriction endonuclease